jgi:hypothetical protein
MGEPLEKDRRPLHHNDEKDQEREDREHADGHQPQAFQNHAIAPISTSVQTQFKIARKSPSPIRTARGVLLKRGRHPENDGLIPYGIFGETAGVVRNQIEISLTAFL